LQDVIELVVAAQRGDADAFQALVQRYQDFAYALALARVGDRQLAQDVAQEAFLQAHADLPTLREPRAFASWLRRLVAKHADRLLRGKRLSTVSLDQAIAAQGSQALPLEILEARERTNLVRAELNRLPERERVAVWLYYLADLPQNEIAALLEVPLTTIKKRLHDARRRLKERMMSEFGEQVRELRPSRDAQFAHRVEFLIAVRSGDTARVERQLAADPSLLEVTLAFEDWGRAEMGQPTLPMDFDYTPLLFATNYGLHELAEVLLARGANANVRLRGETPLGRATLMHDLEMVDTLLRYAADPNLECLNGITPLHRAAMRGHAAIVRRLLESDADPDARDRFGRAPADWALLNGWQELAPLLGSPHPPTASSDLPPLHGDFLETGIRVLDVTTPLPRGGAIHTSARGGVGKMVLLAEIAARLARLGGRTVYVRWYERFYRAEDANREQMEAGIDAVSELVLGRMQSSEDERERTLLAGLERAEALRDEGTGRDVLLLVDAPPIGELPLQTIRQRVGLRDKGSITLLVFDLLLPNTEYAHATAEDGWDARLVFDRALARRTIFPALDVVGSWSRLLEDGRVSAEHAATAQAVRQLLAGTDPALDGQRERALGFQAQPFFVAEPWTARPGAFEPLATALAGYQAIVEGSNISQ
jgi:RNA polymerase sigma factor (sigma-70 family)